MSYEGTTRYICQDGHLTHVDSMTESHFDDIFEANPVKCPCGKWLGFLQAIDETNGDETFDDLVIAVEHKVWWKRQYVVPSYVVFATEADEMDNHHVNARMEDEDRTRMLDILNSRAKIVSIDVAHALAVFEDRNRTLDAAQQEAIWEDEWRSITPAMVKDMGDFVEDVMKKDKGGD